MTSRYSSMRNTGASGSTSRYSAMRSPDYDPEREREEAERASSLVRNARNEASRQREEQIKAENEQKMRDIGMDYASQYGPNSPVARKAQEVADYAESRPPEPKKTTAQKVVGALRNVGNALSDFREGFEDTLSFGATSALNRGLADASFISPELRERYERNVEEANNPSAARRIGEIGGYIAPGAAIESAVSAVARPVLQNVPRLARSAITYGTAGAVDAAAQEAGDVAFRGREFDPLNVALGAGVGAALPVVGRGVASAYSGLRRMANNVASDAVQGNLRAVSQAVIDNTVAPPQTVRRVVSPSRVPEVFPERVRRDFTNASPVRSAAPDQSVTPENVTVQTASEAPANIPLFQRLFGNEGLGARAGGSGGMQRVGEQAQLTDNPLVSDAAGIKDAAKQAGRTAYQTMVDALSPIKRVFGERAYNIAMDANRASNIANNIVQNEFVDMEGNVLGKGLRQIWQQVPRGLDNEASTYLVLRDAKDRIARGEKVFDPKYNLSTPIDIKNRILEYEKKYPKLVQFGKDWDAFTNNIRQVYGVDSGLLSQESKKAMEAARPNYVPMNRQFSLSERIQNRGFGRSSNSFSGNKAPIKKSSEFGSTRRIVDSRKSTMNAVQQWVQNAMNNRVLSYIGDEIMANPEMYENVAEIVRTNTSSGRKLAKAFADEDELAQAVASGNEEEFIGNLSKEFRKLFEKAKAGEETIVRYMKNGQPVAIRLKDPDAVRAIISMGPQQMGIGMKILGTMSNAVKRSATGALAPAFALRQLGGDIVQSLIQSPNPIRHLGDYMHALTSSVVEAIPGLRNTKLAELANDYRRVGGVYSSLMKTEKGVKRNYRNMRRAPYLSPRGIAQLTEATIKAPFRALEKVGDIAENVNRMAAYKGARRKGGSARTPENIRNAVNAAREITTNFSRRGSAYGGMEALVPYSNAAVQGARRIGSAIKNNPVRTAIGVTGLVIAPKMYEYAMFANDPDYQKIPARERYTKLFLSKRPDGSFVTLKMPPEYMAMGALTEDLMRRYVDGDEDAMKGIADAITNAYTPPLVSGAAQAFTQDADGGTPDWVKGAVGAVNATSAGAPLGAVFNQNYFGSPIVPQSMKDLSAKNQFDEKTTLAAKSIGQALGMSPKKVDYVLRQYTGDIGRYVLPLTSTTGQVEAGKTLAKNFITDPVYTNTLADDYYNAVDMIKRVNADAGVGDTPPSWYTEDIRKLATSTAKGTPGAVLKDLNAQKKAINADKVMSASQKARQLRDLQVRINTTYVDILSKLEDAGVPAGRK